MSSKRWTLRKQEYDLTDDCGIMVVAGLECELISPYGWNPNGKIRVPGWQMNKKKDGRWAFEREFECAPDDDTDLDREADKAVKELKNLIETNGTKNAKQS